MWYCWCMASRKNSDARRFDFCTRCLGPWGPERLLVEHHLRGRKNDHTAIVFICKDCHPHVENSAAPIKGPIKAESRALSLKRDLLVQSRALRWVVKNSQAIVDGFVTNNRKGPNQTFSPGSAGWEPPFGAVGHSGEKYYFIPPDHLDGFVEAPTNPTSIDDGIGDPAGDANWVRFKGTPENILDTFLDAHRDEGSPGEVDVEMLRQA